MWNFVWKNLKNGERSNDEYVDGRITLKRFLNEMFLVWFHIAQFRHNFGL